MVKIAVAMLLIVGAALLASSRPVTAEHICVTYSVTVPTQTKRETHCAPTYPPVEATDTIKRVECATAGPGDQVQVCASINAHWPG